MDFKSASKSIFNPKASSNKLIQIHVVVLTTFLLLPHQFITAKSLSKVDYDDSENRIDVIGSDGAGIFNHLEDSETEQKESAAWRFADSEICNIYENEPLHALMDRICELCHEMFSHEKPNMRAECRADCFRSDDFKHCLRLFKPITHHQLRRQTRTKHRHHSKI